MGNNLWRRLKKKKKICQNFTSRWIGVTDLQPHRCTNGSGIRVPTGLLGRPWSLYWFFPTFFSMVCLTLTASMSNLAELSNFDQPTLRWRLYLLDWQHLTFYTLFSFKVLKFCLWLNQNFIHLLLQNKSLCWFDWFDAATLPVSQGLLGFHSRSGWHENDLAGEWGVRGHEVRTRLRYRSLVSPEETGEGSCHSLSRDHSTEP